MPLYERGVSGCSRQEPLAVARFRQDSLLAALVFVIFCIFFMLSCQQSSNEGD